MHYIFVINGREDKRWIADEVARQIRQAGSDGYGSPERGG